MTDLSVYIKILFYVALSAWLVSCSTAPRISTNTVHTQSPAYSLLFVIHGDANYVFHDTVGVVHHANEDVLARAQAVALANPQAEVFIFHDKPLRKTLFLFKQHDGEFYYYRNGELVAMREYWRDAGTSRFSVQGALYDAYRSRLDTNASKGITRMLLYFGHEIPEFDGQHYDESYPDSTLTINKFSNALRSFTNQEHGTGNPEHGTGNPKLGTSSQYFDLIVMSTCYNGSPHSIAALAPYTRYIIASPTSLHLSYFDLEKFRHLEQTFGGNSMKVFAQRVAESAYDRLSASVQTVVGVSVYDIALVIPYTNSIAEKYSQTIAKMNTNPNATIAHCDCADLAPFNNPLMHNGVQVLYRAPLFGRDANKILHSGWSCWTVEGGKK